MNIRVQVYRCGPNGQPVLKVGKKKKEGKKGREERRGRREKQEKGGQEGDTE